jgi:Type II restriction enzyme SfiI
MLCVMEPMRDVSATDLSEDEIESLERVSLRLVVQALVTFGRAAWDEFRNSTGKEQDIAEDIVRDALDELPGFIRRERVLGTVDYRKARWMPSSFGLVPQALYVDAKASKEDYRVNLQLSQISMLPHFISQKSGSVVAHAPGVPTEYPFHLPLGIRQALTTTIFVQFIYASVGKMRILQKAIVIAVPNGRLQHRYAPSPKDTIWNAGKHSPKRNEEPRARLSIDALKRKARWRVQDVVWTADAGEVSCAWIEHHAGTEVTYAVVADAR